MYRKCEILEMHGTSHLGIDQDLHDRSDVMLGVLCTAVLLTSGKTSVS